MEKIALLSEVGPLGACWDRFAVGGRIVAFGDCQIAAFGSCRTDDNNLQCLKWKGQIVTVSPTAAKGSDLTVAKGDDPTSDSEAIPT